MGDRETRFLSHVVKRDDGCWTWTGVTQSNGYGIFSYGSKVTGNRLAHRVAYELWKEPIPEGAWILHTCRHKCVNPDHLEAGTPSKNNSTDKIRDGSLLVGERNPSVKYTAETVREIRQRYANGETQMNISRSLGIRQGHISDICLRKVWKCVE